jgi:hypothetical protein
VKDVADELGRGDLWAVVVLERMLQGRKTPTLVMKTPLDYFVQYQGWPHGFVDALVDLQNRVPESRIQVPPKEEEAGTEKSKTKALQYLVLNSTLVVTSHLHQVMLMQRPELPRAMNRRGDLPLFRIQFVDEGGRQAACDSRNVAHLDRSS